MGAPISPSRFLQQPQQPVEIDKAWNIRFAISGAFPGRSLTGPAAAQVGTVTRSVGPVGRYQSFNGTDQGLQASLDLTNTRAVTVVAVIDRLVPTSSFQNLWEFGADVVGYSSGFDAYLNSSGGLELWLGAGGGRQGNLYVAPPPGPHTWVAIYDATKAVGTQISLYIDGILQTVIGSPISSATDGPFAADTLYVGSRTSSGSWASMQLGLIVVADRAYSRAEAERVSMNAWQVFRAPQRRFLAVSGTTVPAYTFTLSPGAFALSGAVGLIAVARRVVAATAGYAMAGAAAKLVAARKLTATSGALSLTGATATLRAGRLMLGTGSTAAVSGSNARLVAARKLSGQPAAFALSGGSAVFNYTPIPGSTGPTYTLVGGSGLFLMTTRAAGLLLSRRLVSAAGVFSYGAGAARIAAARRLVAVAASFSATGSSAGLRAARRLAVSFGAFGMTAVPVRLSVSRRLPVAAGAFAIAGIDVLIKYSSVGGRIEIDASQIPASRFVVFGGGSRTVVFGGSSRVVPFGGGTRVVVFDVPSIEKANSMANADKPYFKDGKWWVDKDPDEKSYYVADVTKELADRGTTAESVEVIVGGVTVTEGPEIQGPLIVVKLEGMDEAEGADNFWTARVTCTNTERFDRTTWLSRVDN